MAMPGVQLFLFGIVIFCDLGSSIYDRYYLNTNDQIGYAAHFGGNNCILQNLSIQKNLFYGLILMCFRCCRRSLGRNLLTEEPQLQIS